MTPNEFEIFKMFCQQNCKIFGGTYTKIGTFNDLEEATCDLKDLRFPTPDFNQQHKTKDRKKLLYCGIFFIEANNTDSLNK